MKPRINFENMNTTTTNSNTNNNNTNNNNSSTQDSGYLESSPTTLKNEKRKMRKVVVERLRRERIDRCLQQLQDILIQSNPPPTQSSSSLSTGSHLEKADILEKTVDHVRDLERKLHEGVSRGYQACMQQVHAYMQLHRPTQTDNGDDLISFLHQNMDSALHSFNGSYKQMKNTNSDCNIVHGGPEDGVLQSSTSATTNTHQHIWKEATTNNNALTSMNFPPHNNILNNNTSANSSDNYKNVKDNSFVNNTNNNNCSINNNNNIIINNINNNNIIINNINSLNDINNKHSINNYTCNKSANNSTNPTNNSNSSTKN
ncbi:hypothetical protein HELRODRAFT_177334 [Helobdella robusta]|uniref:BHLH domain-containing protein n=1 Tax=Helobdella robusta TaxID=6412 RepID=T1FBI7_HELRO|nr:hypothetical protein HELRODRAFT_177334 [Helobdella robusta]ESN98097.1 hypothetical protein HELRODRAFT_177334 [Helobdella robusta]